MILNDEVNRVFITYKDRLTRFGYHYIETICKHYHVEIVVVNQKEKSVSIEEELNFLNNSKIELVHQTY